LVSVIFAISAASLASTPSSMSFLLKATYWRLGLGFGPTPKAKPWKGEGSGVLEILEDHRGDTFLSPFNSPEPNRKTLGELGIHWAEPPAVAESIETAGFPAC